MPDAALFKQYNSILKKVPLFEGISEENRASMLACIGARAAEFPRGADIVRAGEQTRGVGVLLAGEAQVCKEDAFGRRSIITDLGKGDVFGEVFVCAGIRKSPVTVIALADAAALFLDYERMINTCSASCPFHAMLIRNMLKILAQKNLGLNRKIDYLTIKSLRGRIAAYLLSLASEQAWETVRVPFDRNGLADYLGADRSALSRELGRMRDEGLVAYHKNEFHILEREKLRELYPH